MPKRGKKKQAAKSRVPNRRAAAPRPPGELSLLEQAAAALQLGNLPLAIRAAGLAIDRSSKRAESDSGRQLLAEALFRTAMAAPSPSTGLKLLDQALSNTPQDLRLHFHRGTLLMRSGQYEDALAALNTVAAGEPDRPRLAYCQQLAAIALGRPWSAEGLTAPEANTLSLVATLVGKPSKQKSLSTLPTPTMGDPALWQTLVALHTGQNPDPKAQASGADSSGRPLNSWSDAAHAYYQGVAAARADNYAAALDRWQRLVGTNFTFSSLQTNLLAALREQAVAQADAGQWAAVTKLQPPRGWEDRILAETIGLAYFHLGSQHAKVGDWHSAAAAWQAAAEWNSSRSLAQNLALALETTEQWADAAAAWREMVRRRPRSESHPDYLTDGQIAALWDHAADCYVRAMLAQVANEETHDRRAADGSATRFGQAGQPYPNPSYIDEIVTCLKYAVKYAPENVDVRYKLARHHYAAERKAASVNELEQLLETDPNHIAALVLLATIRAEEWGDHEIPLWKRVLALDPQQQEARDGLARSYENQAKRAIYFGKISDSVEREVIQILEEGLEAVPNHPALLLGLGMVWSDSDPARGRDYMCQASKAAKDNINLLAVILHEMLHWEMNEEAEAQIQELNRRPYLLPEFWFAQTARLIERELDEQWIARFIDAAIELTEKPYVTQTRASLLVTFFEIIDDKYEEAAKAVRQRIHDEAGKSGAQEYLAAIDSLKRGASPGTANRHLRKAKAIAAQQGETVLGEMIAELEQELSNPFARMSQDLDLPDIARLANLFDLDELPDLDDEQELGKIANILKRMMGGSHGRKRK